MACVDTVLQIRLASLAILLAMQGTALAAKADLTVQPWGKTASGETIELYTLTNSHGMEARITNFGAILVSLKTPDREGRWSDVVPRL